MLQGQISELKEEQQSGWPKEKEMVHNSRIEKGFDYFQSRFLANDPN